MMLGMILLWHGEAEDIPPGFAVCDGNNGTPDLRNKFVVGAGDIFDPGDTGGSATHTHTFTSDGHNHELDDTPQNIADGNYRSKTTTTNTDSGTTDAGSSYPPYHALLYIMYVGL